MTTSASWQVPAACTLPEPERPGRAQEFGTAFARGLIEEQRTAPTRLRWLFAADQEDRMRDLAAREGGCCSFFTFTLTRGPAGLEVLVEVPPEQVQVLDMFQALASEARTAARADGPRDD